MPERARARPRLCTLVWKPFGTVRLPSLDLCPTFDTARPPLPWTGRSGLRPRERGWTCKEPPCYRSKDVFRGDVATLVAESNVQRRPFINQAIGDLDEELGIMRGPEFGQFSMAARS